MAGISVPPPRRGRNQSLESYRKDLLVYRAGLTRQVEAGRARFYGALTVVTSCAIIFLAFFIAGARP